jgi:hypothetical protein
LLTASFLGRIKHELPPKAALKGRIHGFVNEFKWFQTDKLSQTPATNSAANSATKSPETQHRRGTGAAEKERLFCFLICV